MATITKIKGKKGTTYKVRIRRKGHKEISANFPNKATAQKFIDEYDTPVRALKYLEIKEATKHTLGDAIRRYFDEGHAEELKSKAERISHLTIINELVGERLLSSFHHPATISELESMLKSRKTRKGNKLTNATINRYFSSLSSLFQVTFERWYWVESNPMRKFKRGKEKPKPGRYLTSDELKKVNEYCLSHLTENISIIILLALSTGMRKNEIRYLKWTNVSFENSTITIDETKNGESRTVPLVEPVLSILKEYAKVRHLKTDWIFCGPYTHKTNQPFAVDHPWIRFREKTGLTNFRFHDLRHSCASYLAAANQSPRTIAQVLGHKTIAMAMKYSHLNVEVQREALANSITPLLSNEK